MKFIRGILFIIFIFVSIVALASLFGLDIVPRGYFSEPAQMLLLGICLIGLAGYSRKRLHKE